MPEYLSKLGGSPSNLEMMISNQTNEMVYSADPMSKIKGSKASLKYQYYQNQMKIPPENESSPPPVLEPVVT